MDNIKNKRIVYKRLDGVLSILVPSSECKSLHELAQSVPKDFSYRVLDQSDIPSDRTFRDAWELSDD